MNPSPKTVLVTGTSRGIGKAMAEKYLKNGWQVVGISRSPTSSVEKHPLFFPFHIDLEDLSSLPKHLKTIQSQFPTLHAIICNAGRGHFGHLEECSYEQIQKLVDLNFLSQVYLTKAFLPEMKKRRQGDIIFIGSEAALEGKRKGSIYCATKFALRGFTQALRDECATSNVRVTIINPGMVQTDFFSNLHFRPGNDPTEHLVPDDVAEAVYMVTSAREGTVFDEINLSPQKSKVLF